jgi:hypothetical protein
MLKKQHLVVVVLIVSCLVASFLFAGSLTGRRNINPPLQRMLVEAGRDAGAEINTAEIYSLVRNHSAMVVAPLRGYENVEARSLPQGVDVAFGYFQSATNQLPAGFYKLRASAQNVRLGKITGTVQFIAQDGSVALEVPARMEVRSLTLPPRPLKKRTFVETDVVMSGPYTKAATDVWFICSNGLIICFYEVD